MAAKQIRGAFPALMVFLAIGLGSRLAAAPTSPPDVLVAPTASGSSVTYDSTTYTVGAGTHPLLHTIQGGVNALTGSRTTVVVMNGTYSEYVQVNKAGVYILGVNYATDARTRFTGFSTTGPTYTPPTSEAVNNGEIDLNASNITLEGFTFQNADGEPGGSDFGQGIFTSGSASVCTVKNNVFWFNVKGLYLNSSGSTETTVSQNVFYNNNGIDTSGGSNPTFDENNAAGNGIYSDFGVSSVTITQNLFELNTNASVVIVNGGSVTANSIQVTSNKIVNDATLTFFTCDNVTVDNNTITTPDGSGIYFASTSNITVNGNFVKDADGSGVYLDGGCSAANITNNVLIGNYYGVHIRELTVASQITNVHINNNEFNHNSLAGVSAYQGAYGGSTSPTTVPIGGPTNSNSGTDPNSPNLPLSDYVDARCNFWGTINGPTDLTDVTPVPTVGNGTTYPSGPYGDAVEGPVLYSPADQYTNATPYVTITMIQSENSPTLSTYIQVIRITNNGPGTLLGIGLLVVDSPAAGMTLTTATGTQTDGCLPPTGSPVQTALTSGSTMTPGQSVLVTLRWTATTVGTHPTFITGDIGGSAGTAVRCLVAAIQ